MSSSTMTAEPLHLEKPELQVLPPPVWVDGGPSLAQITDDIAHPMEARPGKGWWICFGIAFAALLNLGGMVTYLIANGIGVWGLNNSVGWAFDITNFVFWIGIGHAGTLISAILLLFRQQWRTSINRSAEAMTLFAVACAAMFPGIHMGRPWLAHFIFPYFPNQRGPLWVNFRSPLVWDVVAISTYGTISLVFWYLGLVPDLATLRDRAQGKIKKFIFGLLSLGWNGSHRTWSRYEITSLILAGLATPLVLSVHSIVSMDFATSLLPGWHTTIFPPYFVAGAIYSGFGMVMTLLIITRQTMHLERYITVRHLDKMAKVTMLTGMIVSYAYATEFFSAWYSGNIYERAHFINRATGPYAWCFYLMVLCNVITPHFLWTKKARTTVWFLFIVSILINIGMWFERFVIIVVSLHRAFLPSGWGMFYPTKVDIGILVGSFGLFFTLFLLFIRVLPMIAMWEIKNVASHTVDHKMAHGVGGEQNKEVIRA
ncbi:MAG TPA: NrfD/PsrC family molybdoenzyme membrane anchor subunit [Candidatus Saccharimonadales bacterium]|jgi:Ni/Fe-hydrogenase subunit HybB-like protein|nr:NrfD/PsrC family molybdoenzyme membrane anchor subunit [Candidatus Saccharimonadales bacterium]